MIRQIEIAGVTLSIESNDLEWSFEDGSHYRGFEVVGQCADAHVDVHWNPAGIEDLGDEVFSARDMPGRFPPNWRLYCTKLGGWNLEVNASPYPLIRRRVAVFQPDFRRGDVYVDLRHRGLDFFPYPLSAPLDRVLFVHLVTHGLGVMIHACGIVLNGKGYLFAGPSNSGKTTLSRLWSKATDATILGDECLILRKRDGKFWIYGTPWVGEAGLYSPVGAPVEMAFFIHHARQNLVTALGLEQAAERLLAQSILTPHDAFAIQYGLDLCLDFVGGVPAYQFGFVPEKSAVQLIQKLVGNA